MERIKGYIDIYKIIVGNGNVIFSITYIIIRQKIRKKTLKNKQTINQLDLPDIHRTLHPVTVDYAISQVHMDQSRGYSTYINLQNKFNKMY